jgi:hypothetical protein
MSLIAVLCREWSLCKWVLWFDYNSQYVANLLPKYIEPTNAKFRTHRKYFYRKATWPSRLFNTYKNILKQSDRSFSNRTV